MRLISLNLLGFLLLSACSLRLPFLHQQDISQGNVYPPELRQKLELGMTPEQVHRLLGTPQLSDPFRPQEDTYVYRYFSGASGQTYQGRLNLFYQNGRLSHIDEQPVRVLP